jgi:hypothetical protein
MVTWGGDASATRRHFLYPSSYSALLERFVQSIVICPRTTERVRSNKKRPTSTGNSRFVLPPIKKLYSSAPLTEVLKKNKKNCKHVLKRIFLPLALLFRHLLQIRQTAISI